MGAIRGAGIVIGMLVLAGCGGGSAAAPAPADSPATLSAPAAAPPAAPPRPANPDADAVESGRPALRACYDKARAGNASLGRTTVVLSLRVDETGTVSTVDLEYKHRFDDAAKACMREAALAIKLPAGAARRVEVPMTFETR